MQIYKNSDEYNNSAKAPTFGENLPDMSEYTFEMVPGLPVHLQVLFDGPEVCSHNTLAKSYGSKVGLIIQKRCILVTVFAAVLFPILLYFSLPVTPLARPPIRASTAIPSPAQAPPRESLLPDKVQRFFAGIALVKKVINNLSQ